MSQQPRVSVCAIVLSYNAREDLVEALRFLEKSSFPTDILVVDNSSENDPSLYLRENFPRVNVKRLSLNKGFAGGMNEGIRWALERKYDFVWLINQDARVERGALIQLLEVATQNSQSGLVSPIILKQDGTPWFLGGKISYGRMRAFHTKDLQQKPFFESEYLTGCALLLSRNLILKIGLLDEGYFLYYEDVEYSLRARRYQFIPLVVPAAKVVHTEQSSFREEKIYWLVRSGIRLFRNESPWYWRPWIEIFLLLRRLKNTLEKWLWPSRIASLVGQAYTDASHEKQ